MNEIVSFHGAALATAGRLDIRAMMRHYTAPYMAAVPFQDLIQTIKRNSTPARRSNNQRPSAAIEIRKAVAGHMGAVVRARDHLSVVMLAPDEENVRQILGAMMAVFPTPPTQTAGYFIDTLVMELQEPEIDHPFSLPAIAAAAREMWQTLPSQPSIAEFLVAARKHQQRLDVVFKQLGDIIEAADWAAEESVKKPPVVVPNEDEDWDIPS